MKKLLIVYNTCGIARGEQDIRNAPYYISCLENILAQNIDGFDITLSSCKNSKNCIDAVKNHFGNRIHYSLIDDVVPVNVTFNHSVIESVKHLGEFEGYVYLDSGATFTTVNDLQNLYNLMRSGPYGMVSALADTDTGLEWIFPDLDVRQILSQQHFVIPVGKGINNHVQIFANPLLQYYHKLIPDIFASYCTESVFSFMNAALKMQWVVSKDVWVHHQVHLDISSGGFNPEAWMEQGNETYDHPFIIPSILERIRTPQAYQLGLGYEEFRQIMMHDPKQYDQDGYCINPQLKDFIRDKLFLTQSEFDYSQLNSIFER